MYLCSASMSYPGRHSSGWLCAGLKFCRNNSETPAHGKEVSKGSSKPLGLITLDRSNLWYSAWSAADKQLMLLIYNWSGKPGQAPSSCPRAAYYLWIFHKVSFLEWLLYRLTCVLFLCLILKVSVFTLSYNTLNQPPRHLTAYRTWNRDKCALGV